MKLKHLARLIGLAVGGLAITQAASAGAIITNGTVTLGVRDLGNLNEPGGSPAAGSGTTIVGLRSNATGSDSTSPGCTCEGWGVGIESAPGSFSGVSGFANDAVGTSNVTLVSFTSTASTAKSIVNVGPSTAPILQVTHDFNPNAGTPFLYQVDVSIKNTSGADIGAGLLHYRRVMDWDIPFPGDELVSIQGVPAALGLANGNNVARTDNNGFNSGNPFSFSPFGLTNINFTDASGDIGALFDFEFDALADGATRAFSIFYGVAPDRATADLARSLVDGDASDVEIGLYSYGVCTTGLPACDPASGAPNTFIFGFGAAGGVLEPPPPPPPPGVPEPASLGLAGLGMLAMGAVRRRRRN